LDIVGAIYPSTFNLKFDACFFDKNQNKNKKDAVVHFILSFCQEENIIDYYPFYGNNKKEDNEKKENNMETIYLHCHIGPFQNEKDNDFQNE